MWEGIVMKFDPKFKISQIVYIKTDKEQLPRQVYRYLVYQEHIIYGLASGINVSEHYEFEITDDCNEVLRFTN